MMTKKNKKNLKKRLLGPTCTTTTKKKKKETAAKPNMVIPTTHLCHDQNHQKFIHFIVSHNLDL